LKLRVVSAHHHRMNSADKLGPASFQFKDALVAAPLYGFGLALAWEVGSFRPIGGGGAFFVFSLQEHLLFALGALPIAVGTALLLIYIWVPMRSLPLPASDASWAMVRGLGAVVFLATGVLLTFNNLQHGYMTALTATLALGALFFGLGLATAPQYILSFPIPVTLAAALWSMLLSTSLGAFDMERTLDSPAARMASVSTGGPVFKAAVLRAGDRGVLVFDGQTIKLVKWEDLKSIEWAWSPYRVQ
jgi:hypothetical protein